MPVWGGVRWNAGWMECLLGQVRTWGCFRHLVDSIWNTVEVTQADLCTLPFLPKKSWLMLWWNILLSSALSHISRCMLNLFIFLCWNHHNNYNNNSSHLLNSRHCAKCFVIKKAFSIPVLWLPSLWQRKEIETQYGCTTCTWLLRGKREPGLDPSQSDCGLCICVCSHIMF